MSKRLRKMGAIALAAVTMIACNMQNAKAAERLIVNDTEMVVVQSAYSEDVNANITISNAGKATATSKVIGKFGITTKISMKLKLQKYVKSEGSWTTVKTWDKSASSSSLSMNYTYQLSKKGTYRTKLSATVWSGSKSETVSKTSGSKTY